MLQAKQSLESFRRWSGWVEFPIERC